MRGGEVKEGSPNKERGGCIDAGSLQSQPGANQHPNTANKRVGVAKGGEADGVALTEVPKQDSAIPEVSADITGLRKAVQSREGDWMPILSFLVKHTLKDMRVCFSSPNMYI
jgi:hypothetical protein